VDADFFTDSVTRESELTNHSQGSENKQQDVSNTDDATELSTLISMDRLIGDVLGSSRLLEQGLFSDPKNHKALLRAK
jgi:hypothetical protein